MMAVITDATRDALNLFINEHALPGRSFCVLAGDSPETAEYAAPPLHVRPGFDWRVVLDDLGAAVEFASDHPAPLWVEAADERGGRIAAMLLGRVGAPLAADEADPREALEAILDVNRFLMEEQRRLTNRALDLDGRAMDATLRAAALEIELRAAAAINQDTLRLAAGLFDLVAGEARHRHDVESYRHHERARRLEALERIADGISTTAPAVVALVERWLQRRQPEGDA